LDHQDELTGLVLSAPALASNAVPKAAVPLLRGLAKLAPTLRPAGIDGTKISKDPAVVAAYQADPLVHQGNPTLGLSVRLFAQFDVLPERARARSWGEPAAQTLFDQPVTIVGGGGITLALIRLLEPFRTQVTVVRRSAEPVPGATRTVTTEHLHEALTGAQAVVLTLALTPQTRGLISQQELELMDQLRALNRDRGMTLIVVTHNLRLAELAGRSLHIADGRLVS